MTTSNFLRVLGIASTLVVVGACGSDGNEAADEGLLFHGEAKLLEGFKFDTGPQPSSGPASVTLRLSGGGTLKVDARGNVAGGKVVGRAGSGQLQLDAKINLDGTLKIDSPVKKSTGDIPGLKDINVPIAGKGSFDPFLLEGGDAEVTADIPETKLPDVPLGSVPGKLQLTVVAGSKLTSKFHANCMTVTSGSAQYEGDAETSGTLVIKGTIVLELPSPLNKSIELPNITVPIPSAKSKVEFAAVATSGAADDKTGVCSGTAGGDAGGTDTTTSDDSAPIEDTWSTTDSASVEDDGAIDADSDTSTGDTAPTCTGERFEPDNTLSSARSLGAINDCDGSGSTASGVLSDFRDVDIMRFDGNDSFGCSVNAYAKVASGSVRICLKPYCSGGLTDYQGCAKGSPTTNNECCGTGEVEAKYNCTGTSDDNARVYITVTPYGTIGTCASYSVQYHL